MRNQPWLLGLLSFVVVLGAASWYVSYVNLTHPAPWPMAYGDPGRRNYADAPLPTAPALLWSHTLSQSFNGWIVAGQDGTIYLGAGEDLQAIDKNGLLLWTWRGSDRIYTVALGRQGHIYVQDAEGVRALDAQGQMLWLFPMTQRGGGNMMVGQGGVIYTLGLPYLYAIADNGQEKWRYQLSGLRAGPAEAKDGRLLLVLGSDLVALGRDGTEEWRVSIGEPAPDMALMVDQKGTAYVKSSRGLWSRDTEGVIREVEYRANRAFSNIAAGKRFVQDGLTRYDDAGRELWALQRDSSSSGYYGIVDSRGNALFLKLTGLGVTITEPIGPGVTVVRKRVTIVDPQGRIVWEDDPAVPLGPVIAPGDGRFCFVGRQSGLREPELLCFGAQK